MAKIDDLINRIDDEELQNRIREEVRKLKKQKKFGLVYEEHLPEATPLYDVPIKQGSTVVKRDGDINEVYYVSKIEGDILRCIRMDRSKKETIFDIDEMVTVSQFGQPIFPFLKPLDRICNAPDSDLWHILIESDNYHALQLLLYLYEGKVDCIYIDPPYNTGARDWKYNNDYVAKDDKYRHSKWLSFMEHRLKLARRLLNPKESVLIVTIDEKEQARLGLLLEQLFPDARIQMVDSIINRKGVSRKGMQDGKSGEEVTQFSRVSEYIYFVMFGKMSVVKSSCNMLDTQTTDNDDVVENDKVQWLSMLRRGAASHRPDKPKHFYPIFVEPKSATIKSVGEPIPIDMPKENVTVPDGLVAVWPMRTDGSEGRWQLKKETFEKALSDGTAKLGSYNKKTDRWAINYLNEGIKDEIKRGAIIVVGKDDKGALVLKRENKKLLEPKSVWNQVSHNSSEYGTTLLNSIIGSERFSYPKSLYAVQDTVGLFVKDNPNALILDFFAGSGTTLHAVNLLNSEDGGKRKCILVTNNEVSNAEAKNLREQGYRQGDDEWERLGIAHYVTWPRTVCSIKGQDINGAPLNGTYLSSDNPMSDGFKSNAIFFKLGFLDKDEVSLGRNLKELLPMLWMKANAIGDCPTLNSDADIPEMLILPKNKMAVLIDEDSYPEFRDKVNLDKDIETVFIATDSEDGYREMISRLDVKQTYQLFRDYLDNFTLNKR